MPHRRVSILRAAIALAAATLVGMRDVPTTPAAEQSLASAADVRTEGLHPATTYANRGTLTADGAITAIDAADNPSADGPDLVVTTPQAPSTETLTFLAGHDATLQATKPGTNYGNLTALAADGSPVKDFLVRFDLSGIGDTRGAERHAPSARGRPVQQRWYFLTDHLGGVERSDRHLVERAARRSAVRRVHRLGDRRQYLRLGRHVDRVGGRPSQPARQELGVQWRGLRLVGGRPGGSPATGGRGPHSAGDRHERANHAGQPAGHRLERQPRCPCLGRGVRRRRRDRVRADP